MYHCLFIKYLLMDLGCLRFLAIVNNAPMNTSVQISCQVPAFNVLEVHTQDGIARTLAMLCLPL